jgi:hypothetical protein
MPQEEITAYPESTSSDTLLARGCRRMFVCASILGFLQPKAALLAEAKKRSRMYALYAGIRSWLLLLILLAFVLNLLLLSTSADLLILGYKFLQLLRYMQYIDIGYESRLHVCSPAVSA